ncbi:hypothetical protein SDRG_06770 [Saprolegnia diclina VS20]|uniref:50S ribosomal protein L35 n=1 Tax=Saprolegnia diclina (strain VS20) TaxID=1156394 RepID=T0S0A6_SAPDV|nr:hypothetical protein SDRG_06770 [Saprolegnia diclina VS20]EQC36032.1 hypothetical protein SDRG_06770 [Saprolegnia diclina VS20]|eukprot:XP_008610794.1 hypothetical protein SDRG_06770 [Saprolegnia diclina VS20]
MSFLRAATLTTSLWSRSALGFAQPPTMMCMQVREMGYKLKTKSGVKKRFFVNSNGHIKRAVGGKRHLATDKTRQHIRRLGKAATVLGKMKKNILAMLRV